MRMTVIPTRKSRDCRYLLDLEQRHCVCYLAAQDQRCTRAASEGEQRVKASNDKNSTASVGSAASASSLRLSPSFLR